MPVLGGLWISHKELYKICGGFYSEGNDLLIKCFEGWRYSHLSGSLDSVVQATAPRSAAHDNRNMIWETGITSRISKQASSKHRWGRKHKTGKVRCEAVGSWWNVALSGVRGLGWDPKVSGSAANCLADLGQIPAPPFLFLVQRTRAIFHKYLPR